MHFTKKRLEVPRSLAFDSKEETLPTLEHIRNGVSPYATALEGFIRAYDACIVRIRPRMSIVKAVRLLTEARKQGVELWMQKTPPFCEPSWSKLSSTGIEMFACTYHHGEDWKDWSMSTGHILSKWIVATPEDARRIDAKRGS
mgnify:FL=1